MFGNPMDAAISSEKAFRGLNHYTHVKSPYASQHDRIFEKDVLLMEEHFDRWMRPQSFPFLSIRYEDLYSKSVRETLSTYVGSAVRFPEKKMRGSDWQSHPARDKLQSTYRSLAEKVRLAPSVKLWPSKDAAPREEGIAG